MLKNKTSHLINKMSHFKLHVWRTCSSYFLITWRLIHNYWSVIMGYLLHYWFCYIHLFTLSEIWPHCWIQGVIFGRWCRLAFFKVKYTALNWMDLSLCQEGQLFSIRHTTFPVWYQPHPIPSRWTGLRCTTSVANLTNGLASEWEQISRPPRKSRASKISWLTDSFD